MKVVRKTKAIEYTIVLNEEEAQLLGHGVEQLSDYGPVELGLEFDGWQDAEVQEFFEDLAKRLPRQV